MAGSAGSVLDASAVLALLHREPGFGQVLDAIGGAAISAVNLAEVQGKTLERGVQPSAVAARLRAVGVRVEPFLEEDAAVAASMLPVARAHGLSLADRACLALGLRLGRPVLATDRSLADANVGVDVVLIR